MSAPIIYSLSVLSLVWGQQLLSNQRCNLAAHRGECTNFAVKWHYDRYAHRCRQFYFGGCGGNENRFETQEECDAQCRFVDNSVLERCSQPYDAGNCHSDISRHYFDMAKGACICANFTGCGGNNNMFYSFDQCMSVCGQFAKPNHIQIHDNTAEYSHGGSAPLTPLQLLHKQQQSTVHHHQQTHHNQQRVLQGPAHQQQQENQRYQELLRHHGEQQKRHHPVLTRQEPAHSVQGEQTMDEDLGHMKQKREDQGETKEMSIGQTHIIRHNEHGNKFVTKINGHPLVITEKIMEMVRSGRARSIDDAINQLAASNQNFHLTATSQPVPNFVYLNERQPLNPVYKSIPQVTVTKKVTSSSTYQNLPREAFIRPVDPEERRRWKEKMKRKKINPVRRINPSPSTYYEILTTAQPIEPEETTTSVPETTTTTTTTTTRAPIRVPETTTLPLPLLPTQPSSFYQESFDLSKIRKHKETVRNGKIPPQRPIDDYDDDRVPYETETDSIPSTLTPTVPPIVHTTARPTVPPTAPPTTTRATVVLPVSREELSPTPHTEKVLPSMISHSGTHFDLEEGKEKDEEEYEDYEDEDEEGLDDIDNQLTISHRIEPPTTTVPPPPPPTTTHRPTVPPPRPTAPYLAPTVTPTFASRSKEAMERPVHLVPPSFDQTTSSTTTTMRTMVAVTTPRPRLAPTESPEPAVATTRKSLWGSYESEEFDIRPASRGSI